MNPIHNYFWQKELTSYLTVVVANGEVPSSELSLSILKEKKRVICCDGALQKLLSINIVPDVVVGDGDSVDPQLLQGQTDFERTQTDNTRCRDAKFCVSTKTHRVSTEGYKIPYYPDRSEEYNDLQKALRYCTANGYNDVLLMGCGGLREDHFIANLSIMVMCSAQMRLAMLTEHGVFNVLRGTSTFRSFPGMQVSVFTRSPHTKLTFKGLKYPVYDRSFNWLWEGSLNEAVGDAFTVETCGGEPVVIYRTIRD